MQIGSPKKDKKTFYRGRQTQARDLKPQIFSFIIFFKVIVIIVEGEEEVLARLLPERRHFAPFALGRSAETLAPVDEAGDAHHLKHIILLFRSDILKIFWHQTGAETVFGQSLDAERVCYGRFAHITSPGLMVRDGFTVEPPTLTRPFLQASVEMLRVLKIRIAHSHLSILSSDFGISHFISRLHTDPANGQ